jgi:hypothetical protein
LGNQRQQGKYPKIGYFARTFFAIEIMFAGSVVAIGTVEMSLLPCPNPKVCRWVTRLRECAWD